MRALSFAEIETLLRGALGVERSDTALSPVRLPLWAIERSPDPSLTLMARMASGVRLAFVSNTQTLELEIEETGVQVAGDARRPVHADLLIGHDLHARELLTSGPTIVADISSQPPRVSFEAGGPTTLRFDRLPAGEKTLTLYLPQSASVKLLALRVDLDATLAPMPMKTHWLHYGSSISHVMEAAGPSQTWPAIAARALGYDLTNLGFAGQCHIDGFVARAIAGAQPDLITLKPGANIINFESLRERTFRPVVHEFLDVLRDQLPCTPITLISPVFCPVHEDVPGPTQRGSDGVFAEQWPAQLSYGALTMKRIRSLLAEIAEQRQAAGDRRIAYMDGLTIFGEADAHMLPDRLHPNAEAQAIMAERFARALTSRPESPPPPP